VKIRFVFWGIIFLIDVCVITYPSNTAEKAVGAVGAIGAVGENTNRRTKHKVKGIGAGRNNSKNHCFFFASIS